MARWSDDEDDWDDGSEDEPTIPCPHCRKRIHEDSQRCPHCETYISKEDSPAARKPWWIILGVLACLYAVYRWIAG
jgi:hypothetical protein